MDQLEDSYVDALVHLDLEVRPRKREDEVGRFAAALGSEAVDRRRRDTHQHESWQSRGRIGGTSTRNRTRAKAYRAGAAPDCIAESASTQTPDEHAARMTTGKELAYGVDPVIDAEL